jgi:uncharacterized protein (DUF885 family)
VPTEFEQIRDDYYHAWFRYHPEAALDVGVTGYEHLLRPYADQEQGALLSLNEKLLDALDELDESALHADEQLDLQLMRGAAFLEIEQILQYDWRKRDPEEYLPLHAIYQLTMRHSENFAAALNQRLALIPDYLLNARHYIGQDAERIPARWLESAVTAVESGVVFLKALPQDLKVKAHAHELPSLDELITDAVNAFDRYQRYLEQEIGARAAGDFAVGHQRYSHLLRYRHFLDINPDELYEFGKRLFEQTERQLKQVCRRLTGSEDRSLLDEKIRQQGPPQGALLSVCQMQMEAAREFTRSEDLVSFPEVESLSVVQTPVFLRHKIPFAAYEPPSPGDSLQQGHYFVTPAADAQTRDQHSLMAMMHTSVHEGYPGHHLQFTTAHRYPAACSLPRLLNKSATLYEGWALYCEQLMFEKGFLCEPENEFILLKDRLWRALRIIIDTGMQTRGLRLQDAVRMMTDRLGFSEVQGLGEATWYSRAPTVPMGYATGWAMINSARDLALPESSSQKLRSFHDGLLAQGSCALSLGLRRAFGEEFSQRVQGTIREE